MKIIKSIVKQNIEEGYSIQEQLLDGVILIGIVILVMFIG